MKWFLLILALLISTPALAQTTDNGVSLGPATCQKVGTTTLCEGGATTTITGLTLSGATLSGITGLNGAGLLTAHINLFGVGTQTIGGTDVLEVFGAGTTRSESISTGQFATFSLGSGTSGTHTQASMFVDDTNNLFNVESLTTTPLILGANSLEDARFDVNGNFRVGASGVPTVGSNACGTTSQGTVVAGSTNNSGQFTVGTALVTSCVITFANTGFTTAPRSVVLEPANATAAAAATVASYVSAIGTTSFTITGAALASASYYYHVF